MIGFRSPLLLLSLAAPSVFAFVSSSNACHRQHFERSTATNMMNPVLANLVAGSVAGAIGCGLAHPLDTLKTKAQIASSSNKTRPSTMGSLIAQYQAYNSLSPTGLLAMEVTLPFTIENAFQNTFDLSYSMVETHKKPNMLQVACNLYKQEGLEGFYGGVQTMMLGQALIRAVCFTTNAAVLNYLQQFDLWLDASTMMLIAAFSAGITSSLVVTPVERIKVMMQSNPNVYSNELQCIQAVLDGDGFVGLLTRGLGISLIREIPSVGLSFILYALLMQQSSMELGSAVAPLVFGAISGSVSCVPVYPVDCVKTRVQNTEGNGDKNAVMTPLEIAQDLYDNRGVSGFVDGVIPKVLRCAVLSAVSFSVYESILSFLLYTPPLVVSAAETIV